MNKPQPPYFGAAYYPEDWPPEQIDPDIALMTQAGMNAMRIGEFAWSSMEPEDGVFRFDWLHHVVDKLAGAGIGVIMGTPTATPPLWLVERHPEILFVTEEGKTMTHGARRHACPNNEVYRGYCGRIVHKMASEFGHDERILGWQIDNEVYPVGVWPPRSCSCPTCVKLFKEEMRARYGTIETMNRALDMNLWSQAYQYFDQLPTPRRDLWLHPSLLSAWADFTSDSYGAFVKHQADILHAETIHPIGTDMMPFSGVDYADMHQSLDLVQFNHYNEMENLWRAAFWFDFIRPLKLAPFWNTETQTGWNGSVAINGGYKAPGFCRANSWLPIALGGHANLYWLWRQHWAGQEIMHGSVLSSCGRPLHVFDEVREIGQGFAAARDFLNQTRPIKSGLALLWSQKVARLFLHQPIVSAQFDYESTLQEKVYRPLIQAQLRPDVIVPEADLADYKLIVCPFMLTLDEPGLRDKLQAWVKAGGALVIGPLSDVRTREGTSYMDAPYGSLEEWAGVYRKFWIPGFPEDFALQWEDGHRSVGSYWYDVLEPRGAQTLATYADGPGQDGLARRTCWSSPAPARQAGWSPWKSKTNRPALSWPNPCATSWAARLMRATWICPPMACWSCRPSRTVFHSFASFGRHLRGCRRNHVCSIYKGRRASRHHRTKGHQSLWIPLPSNVGPSSWRPCPALAAPWIASRPGSPTKSSTGLRSASMPTTPNTPGACRPRAAAGPISRPAGSTPSSRWMPSRLRSRGTPSAPRRSRSTCPTWGRRSIRPSTAAIWSMVR